MAPRTGVREDRSNRWVIGALGVLGFVDAYLLRIRTGTAF
jgi:hypothetical protein